MGKRYQQRWLNWWVVLIILVLIPTWDVLPAHFYFNKLCEKDAGLHVYKTVNNIEGFYYKNIGKSGAKSILLKYPYKYIEAQKFPKGLMKYRLDNDGNLVMKEISQPTSRYTLDENVSIGENLGWNIKRFDGWIEDTVTGEKLALNRKYGYFGNWVTRIFKFFGATGAEYCPFPRQYLSESYQSILIPPSNIKE